MNILYLLIPIALFLVFASVGGYIWSASRGQYDDLETPAHRILLDEEDKH